MSHIDSVIDEHIVELGEAAEIVEGRLADLGGEMLPGTPKDLASLIVSETEKWAKVVKSAGLKPE